MNDRYLDSKLLKSVTVSKLTSCTTPAASGRDAGLAKAHNARGTKASKKQLTAVDKFTKFRSDESARLARKREMEHKLAMSNANNKRLKYEFKVHEAEANRSNHLETLRLQVELARFMAQAVPTAPAAPLSTPMSVSGTTDNFASNFPYQSSAAASSSSGSLTHSFDNSDTYHHNSYAGGDLNGGLDDDFYN